VTLILGLRDPIKNRAIVCADTGAWRGDEIGTLKTPKLWGADGWVAGFAGKKRTLDAIQFVPFPGDDSPAQLHDYAIRIAEVAARIAELVRRIDLDQKDDGYGLILARGERLWSVSIGEVTETTAPYAVEGAGADYATGAVIMHSLAATLTVAENVMRTVATITTRVHAPFVWMATDGTEGTWT
jgi:hypothetical protein